MKNPLSLEAFADWCDKQPAERPYSYWCNSCAVGQFLQSKGVVFNSIGTRLWIDKAEIAQSIPAEIAEAAIEKPYTFGALAARLRQSP